MKLNYVATIAACLISVTLQQCANARIVLSISDNPTITLGPGSAYADVSYDIFASYDGVQDLTNGPNSNQVGAYGFKITVNGPGTVSNLAGTRVLPISGNSVSWAGLVSTDPNISGSTISFSGGGPVDVADQPYNVTIGTGKTPSTQIGSASFRVSVNGSYTLTFETSSTRIFGGTGFLRSTTAFPPAQSSLEAIFPTASIPVAITAVPEPSSIALIGIAVAFGGACQRLTSRQRRLDRKAARH